MLGMFAIFMVANTVGPKPVHVGSPSPSPTALPTASATAAIKVTPSPSPGVNREKTSIVVSAKGSVLLGNDQAAIADEQSRILQEATAQLNQLFPAAHKRAALVLAFGYHANTTSGETLARIGTAKFSAAGGYFQGAAIATYHNQVGGDPGSAILLDIYFYYD
jgi:hypothetical protein